MKKGWKKLLALGLTGAMLGSLAGCGDGKESQSADASSSAPEKSQSSEKESGDTGELKDSGENVTIKFTWWGNQGRHAYTQELLDEYTELHPNVTFEAIPAGWDGYFDKLSTQAASGSMPDIVQMDYLYLTTYAKNHSVTDLQPFIDNGTIDVSQMAENDVNTGKIDGALAGLVGATGTLSIGYNPEVFQEAGLEEPNQSGSWTWEEFVETAKTIQDKTGKYGVSTGIVDDTNIFNYWVRQHGQQLFSDDNKSLGYDDDQIMVDFLDMWKDLIEADAEPDPDEYPRLRHWVRRPGLWLPEMRE